MASSYQYNAPYTQQAYNPYAQYGSYNQNPFQQTVDPLQTFYTGVNYSLPSNYDIVPYPTNKLPNDLADFDKNFRKTDNTYQAFQKLSVDQQRNIRYAAFHNADPRAVRLIQIVENSLGPLAGNLTSYDNWFTSPNDTWAGNAQSNWFGVDHPQSGWNNYAFNGAILGGPTPTYYSTDPYAQQYGTTQQYGVQQYNVPQQYGTQQYGVPQQYGYNTGYSPYTQSNQYGYTPQMQGGYYPQSYAQQPVNNYWNTNYSF